MRIERGGVSAIHDVKVPVLLPEHGDTVLEENWVVSDC